MKRRFLRVPLPKRRTLLRQLRIWTTVAAIVAISCPSFVLAATFTWDPSGSNAGNPTGGTGNWNTSSLFWSNGSNDVAWTNSGTNVAIFGGTAGTVTLTTGITVGGLTFNTAGYTITGNTLTLGGTTNTITLGNAGTTTISSALSGTTGFTVDGSSNGTLNISGIAAGTWGETGTVTINTGNTLQLGVTSGTSTTFSGSFAGAGNLTFSAVAAATTETLTGTSNSSYTGALTIGGNNHLIIAAPGDLPGGSISIGASGTSAELEFNGAGTYGTSSQTITIVADGTKTLATKGSIYENGAAVVLSSNVSVTGTAPAYIYASGSGTNGLTINGNLTGSIQIQKQGSQTLTLGGTGNTFSGGWDVANGSISVNSASSLGNGGNLILDSANGGNNVSVTLNNASQTIGNLSNTTSGSKTQTLTLTGTALTINESSATTYGGANASITGTGSIILGSSSTGTLTLSTANTYSGGTTISGGTLLVTNSTGSATGSSGVLVNGGILGGTGVISGTAAVVTVTSGGTVYPGTGTSNFNNLTVGGLTLNSGTSPTLKFNLGTATHNDLITVANSGGLTINGGTLSFNNVAIPTSGPTTYDLINYSGSIGGASTSALTLAALAGFSEMLVTTTAGQIAVQFTPTLPVTWTNGSTDSKWNTTSVNWSNTGGSTLYTDGENVTFDNTATPGTVTVMSNVAPGTVTVSNTSGSYTFTGSSITGSSLAVNGGGTLVLQNANSYAGGTSITSGTLQMGSGGTLSGAVSLASGGTFNLNGISQSIGALSGTGGIVQFGTTAGTTLTLQPNSSVTYSGTITGTGSLIMGGTSGSIENLGATSSYTGSTTINGGTLQLGVAGALPSGTTVSLANTSGAVLDLNGNSQTIAGLTGGGGSGGNVKLGAGTLTVGDASSTTFAGNITGSGGNLIKQGAGNLTLTSASGNNYTGTTSILAGTLTLGQAASTTLNLTADGSGTALTGNLVLTNAIRVNLNAGTFAGGGQIQVQTTGSSIAAAGSSATTTLGNNVSSTLLDLNHGGSLPFTTNLGATGGNTLVVDGIITGPSDLNVAAGGSGGAGTLVLNAVNTYSGATTVNNSTNGTVKLGIDNALPAGTALSFAATSGTLDLNGWSQTVASLATAGSNGKISNSGTNDSIFTINGSATTTFGGVISDGSTNKVSLTLASTNAGNLTLSNTNTYTGATTISGGTLLVTVSLAGTGAVNVNSGGTLAGSGSIAGTVTLASGGTIAPSAGTSNFNTLTLAGLVVNSGTGPNLNFNLGAASSNDAITVSTSGGLVINGGTLHFSNIAIPTSGPTTYDLINYSGSIAGSGTGSLTLAAVTGFTEQLVTSTPGQIDVMFTPNPLTWTNGSGDSKWNTTSVNWFLAAATTYTDGNNVTFDNTTTPGTVTVMSNIAPGGVVVSNTSGIYTFTGSAISGSSLAVNGGGTLVLQNANSYSGGTSITSGTLQMGSGGTLSGAVSLSAGGTFDLHGFSQSIGALSGTGGIVQFGTTAGTTLTVQPGSSVTYSGTITGTGSLIMAATTSGVIEKLSGTSSYTGSTTINGGTLQLGVAGALPSGTTVSLANTSGAVLDLNGNSQTIAELSGGGGNGGNVKLGAGTLTVGDASSTTFAGNITGSGGNLIKQGAGNLTLTSASGNNYTGTTSILAGTLTLGQAASTTLNLTADGSGTALTGNLVLTNAIRVNLNAGTFAGGGQIQVQTTGSSIAAAGSSATTTLGNNVSSTILNLNNGGSLPFTTNLGATGGNTLVVDGIITGASDLNVAAGGSGGAGTLVLNAVNTYSGATTVNNSTNGTVKLGIDNALPAGTALTFASTSGTLDLNGWSQTVASLATAGSNGKISNSGTNDSIFTINGSATTTFGGVISDGSTNKVSLTLASANAGNLTFSSTNTYTGGTTIDGGTLTIGSATALSTTGAVTVGGGTLALGSNSLSVGTVSITSGSITGTSGTLTSSSTFDVQGGSISAILAGAVGLNKTSAGSATLSGANTYTGTTAVFAGTLVLGANAPSGSSGALGNATSGVLLGDTTGSSNAALVTNGAFTVGRNITVQSGASGTATIGGSNTSGIANYTGNIALNKDAMFTAAPGGEVQFISGTISGNGGVTLAGGGTIDLFGTNSYDGATQVAANTTLNLNSTFAPSSLSVAATGQVNLQGSATLDIAGSQLLVNNGTISGTVNVSGGLVKGAGLFTNLVDSSGGKVSPGNSPGTLPSTDATWGASGHYVWEINALDPTGTQGSNPGWDLWTVSDTLSITATGSSRFDIDVTSLALDNTPGNLSGFNSSQAYQWLIATAANGAFTAGLGDLQVIDSAFQNSHTGMFSLEASTDGKSLYLDYAPAAVPEPSSLILSVIAAVPMAWGAYRRRRARRMVAADPVVES